MPLDKGRIIPYNDLAIGVWRSLVSRLVRVQEAPGSNPGTPTKKLESAFAGSSFLIGVMGFERPLRKQSGGLFLGRGRIHRFLNAPGTGVGRKRSWSQDCRMVEISIVSKSHKKESPPRGWAFLFGYCDGIRKAGPGTAGVKTVRGTVFRPLQNP